MHRGIRIQCCAIGALTWAGAITPAATQPRAYLVDIREPIHPGTAQVVERALDIADREGAAILIFQIAASGGRMDAAQRVQRAIAAAHVAVFALMTSPSWGPTALLGLAADSLFMGPRSSLTAASSAESRQDMTPDEIAELREAFQDAARRKGLDPQLGAAMVDPSVSIAGVIDSGEVLTLDPGGAVRLGVAAGQAGSVREMLALVGLDELQVITIDAGWIGTTVNVVNRNFREIVVYVARSGTRFRLGMVTSMRSVQFEVPGEFLVPGSVIQVVAEVVGSSDRATTEEIRVEPGLVIDWVIENEIIHSNYFVHTRY